MENSNHFRSYLMIIGAAFLWGTLGVFVKFFSGYHLPMELVAFYRMFLSFVMICLGLLFTNRALLKIDKKSIIYVILIGVFSQGAQTIAYYRSVEMTTIATAVVLLYTSPVFVMIMARIFYKESLTSLKIFALCLCLSGCFLTATGGSLEVLRLNLAGILLGLFAGFGFATATIFTKAIVDRCSPWTIILYAFGFGSMALLPVAHPFALFTMDLNIRIWMVLFLFALIPTTVAVGLYFTGLAYHIEASKAAIITTLEVVVAVVTSALFFHERLWGWKLTGVFMVVVSIIMVNVDRQLLHRLKYKVQPQVNKLKYLWLGK